MLPLTITLIVVELGGQVISGGLVRVPLMIFAGFPAVVTLRAYAQGIAFIEKRTHILALGAPPRLAATWLALMILPYFSIEGAALGVAALFAGFFVEAPTLWWGVRGHQWLKTRRIAWATSSVK